MTLKEEENLKKIIDVLPSHTKQNIVVFITGSDGSSIKIGVLERFNLQQVSVYKVNTSCLYQKCQEKPLLEHLRENCWKMTVANLNAVFSRLRLTEPVSFCGNKWNNDVIKSGNLKESMKKTPCSSQNSINTVIYRYAPVEESGENIPTMSDISTCAATLVAHVITDETIKTHPSRVKASEKFPTTTNQMPERISRNETSSNDEIIVVQYEKSMPEVVVLHHTQPCIESHSKEPPIIDTQLTPKKGFEEEGCSSISDYQVQRISINGLQLKHTVGTSERPHCESTSCTIHHDAKEAQRLYVNEEASRSSLVTESVKETFCSSVDVNHDEKQTNDRIRSFTKCYRPTTPCSGAEMRNIKCLDSRKTTPRNSNVIPSTNNKKTEDGKKYSDGSSEPTSLEQGAVIRYVFDVGTRTHKSHILNGKDCAQREDDQVQEKSRYNEETSSISTKENLEHSTQSTNGLQFCNNQVPTLIRLEDNYAVISSRRTPTETIINFPLQSQEGHGIFQRNDIARRSRHASGTRLRSFDTFEQTNSTVPDTGKITSQERSLSRRTSVATSDISCENIPIRITCGTIPRDCKSETLPNMNGKLNGSNSIKRYSQDLNALSRSGSLAKTMLPLYADTHKLDKDECSNGKINSPRTESLTSVSVVSSKQFEEISGLSEKDVILRLTHHADQQNVNTCIPVYDNSRNKELPPYDFVPDSDPSNKTNHSKPSKSHVMVRKDLGHEDSDQLHHSLCEIQKKSEQTFFSQNKQNLSLTQKPKYTPHQYKDSDYGDNWDDPTISKKVIEIITSPQTTVASCDKSNSNCVLTDGAFQTQPPPPYNQRLCSVAQISTVSQCHDEEREQSGERHLLQVKQEIRSATRNVNKSNWNLHGSRDHCLNCFFFVLGPILIVLIIVVVIVTLIFS